MDGSTSASSEAAEAQPPASKRSGPVTFKGPCRTYRFDDFEKTTLEELVCVQGCLRRTRLPGVHLRGARVGRIRLRHLHLRSSDLHGVQHGLLQSALGSHEVMRRVPEWRRCGSPPGMLQHVDRRTTLPRPLPSRATCGTPWTAPRCPKSRKRRNGRRWDETLRNRGWGR